jgi:polyhydroxyalkanoate synthesis regulator phasin
VIDDGSAWRPQRVVSDLKEEPEEKRKELDEKIEKRCDENIKCVRPGKE